MRRISIALIKPFRCERPKLVPLYMGMLRAGEKAPPIWVIRNRAGSRYRYRIFDGAHRLRAATRLGRKTIEAHILN